MKIVTTNEMRDLEKATDAAGWTYDDMMEVAGTAVAAAVNERLEDLAPGPVLVLAGPGNNGGDGLVAARRLAEWGWQVRVYAWKRSGLKRDPNADKVSAFEIPFVHAEDDAGHGTLQGWLKEAAVLVDALLGTGISRPIEGELAEILRLAGEAVSGEPRLVSLPPDRDEEAGPEKGLQLSLANEPLLALAEATATDVSPLQVVAVDCVSGLHTTSGDVDPAALMADLTVTFGFPKQGHFVGQGIDVTGALLVADIGIPADLAAQVTAELVMPADVSALLPARPRSAHKGTFGKAMIVAGSVYFTGAAALAGAAATRAGAGLVTLAVPRPLHAVLAANLHEVTWLALPHDMGVLASDAARLINEKIEGYKALLIGPGLSTEKETGEFLKAFFKPEEPKARSRPQIGFVRMQAESEAESKATESRRDLPPLVVDADALNWLAQQENWPELLPPNCVLTPHPGEMARLCELAGPAEVNARRWELARDKAAAWQQVVLLKGAYTVIAAPDGRLRVLPFATPALATAGTGDVLAGTIVALLAQGLPAFEAAVAGGYLHGLAGTLAADDIGETGVVAGDVVMYLPTARQRLLE